MSDPGREGLGWSQGSETGVTPQTTKARGQAGQTEGGLRKCQAQQALSTEQGLGHNRHLPSKEGNTLNSVHGPLQLCKEHQQREFREM